MYSYEKEQLRLQGLMDEILDMSDDDPYGNNSDDDPDYEETANEDDESDEPGIKNRKIEKGMCRKL